MAAVEEGVVNDSSRGPEDGGCPGNNAAATTQAAVGPTGTSLRRLRRSGDDRSRGNTSTGNLSGIEAVPTKT